MKTGNFGYRIGTAFLAVLLVVVVLAGCGSPKPSGTTETPAATTEPKPDILVGHLDDFSSYFANQATEATSGYDDAIKYINENGGVNGHKLVTTKIDYKMDPALMSSGWAKLKQQDAKVLTSFASIVTPAMWKLAATDKMVVLGSTAYANDPLFDPEAYIFPLSGQLITVIMQCQDMVAEDWAKRGKSGTPRVVFDASDLSTYVKMYEKLMKLTLGPTGKNWEYLVTATKTAPTDATTQVLQVKQFNPDYIIMWNSEAAMTVWVKELARQQIKPLVIYGTTNASTPSIWTGSAGAVKGLVFYSQARPWDETSNPFVAKLHELNSKWYPDIKTRPIYYVRGFSSFLCVAEALKRTLDKVGYDKFNGEEMKAQMETINMDPGDFSIKPLGKYNIPMAWKKGDHTGTNGALWYQWTEDGKQKLIKDFQPCPSVLDPAWKTDKFWAAE